MSGLERNRRIYVVFAEMDCDCKPCKTAGVHVWAVVGSELAARRMCEDDPSMWWESFKFNDRVKPGHKSEIIL